jgi:hypothetical protein
MHSRGPNPFLEVSPLNPVAFGLSFQHTNFGGHIHTITSALRKLSILNYMNDCFLFDAD